MEIRSRSMNAEMLLGMVDGTYKMIPPNYTGVEVGEEQERRLQHWRYGFEQAPYMYTPDGRKIIPPKAAIGKDSDGQTWNSRDLDGHWG